MEKLWICFILIVVVLGDNDRDENRTKHDITEIKEIMKLIKDQQEEIIKTINEQKEDFAHNLNMLRIQMTQNYRNQKKDLMIVKRQIIRRNERNLESLMTQTAENTSDISDMLRLQKEEFSNYHNSMSMQLQKLHDTVQQYQINSNDSETTTKVKIQEGATIPIDTGTTTSPNTTTTTTTTTTTLNSKSHDRLAMPVMDLNIRGSQSNMHNPYRVAALPGGQAVISIVLDNVVQVVYIDNNGSLIKRLNEFTASQENHYLLHLKDHVYVLHAEGNITKIELDSGDIDHFQLDVDTLWHSGSLSWNTNLIPDILLLSDIMRGEICSYNSSSHEKIVRATNFASPASVSYISNNEEVSYMVQDEGYDQVIYLFNSTWNLIRSFGAKDLHHPTSAIVSPEGTIFVTNYWKSRVTEFTTRGQFVRHVLTENDGIRYPVSMSFSYPHLWVTYYPRRDAKGNLKPGLCDIKRFKLYANAE